MMISRADDRGGKLGCSRLVGVPVVLGCGLSFGLLKSVHRGQVRVVAQVRGAPG